VGQKRGLKNPWAGEEDVFLVHPQNGLNFLILNWCITGCWFTLIILLLRELTIANCVTLVFQS